MVPMESWQNSTPDFGAAAFCTTKTEVYIPQLFPKGGGIKPEDLGKNGEEIWYIRTFFHIFTQKWVNFKFFGEIIAQKCDKK